MTDVLMPLTLRHAHTSVRYLDSSGVSRGMFGGQTIVAARGGDRLGLTLELTKHGGKTTTGLAERAMLRSWLASLRGRQNAVYAQDKSARRRGNFPTGELLANYDLSNGTAGWSAYSTTGGIAASDRTLRSTRTLSNGTNGLGVVNSTALTTLVQFAPYVARAFIKYASNPSAAGLVAAGTTATGAEYGVSTLVGAGGLATLSFVPYSVSSVYVFSHDGIATGTVAGDYIDFSYLSLSRCALVDSGTNLLLRSDEFDNASWTKTRATVTANSATAPDGTVTGDSIVEDSSNNTHSVSQVVTGLASTAADYCFAVALKASTRTWAFVNLTEATGSTQISAYVNLSTGALGTTATGANWADLRPFVRDFGNGWYVVYLVARKTNAATQLTATIFPATGNGTVSYAGDGASKIFAWRATLAKSSVPVRLVNTTGIAQVAQIQRGSALYIKGLPASMSGLLEIDDQVEVVTALGSELKVVTARLNSDAAGLGYLQFEPPLRTSPIDNAPVVIHQPFGRFLFSGDAVGWDSDPGVWSSASAEFEEA